MSPRIISRCTVPKDKSLEFRHCYTVKRVRFWAWVLVVGYIVFILSETIVGRLESDECKYKLLPFWSYLALIRGEGVNIWRCIYLNVLFFIPLGALLWHAFKNRKWWKALLFSFLLSLCIEFAQLVLKKGLCEFDDVFHNTLGCMLGYWLMAGSKMLIQRITK